MLMIKVTCVCERVGEPLELEEKKDDGLIPLGLAQFPYKRNERKTPDIVCDYRFLLYVTC
jgi:hypothetical protein